jgi:hypothetical protein
MSMDALTNVAFESLAKKILPRLVKQCAEMEKIPVDERISNDEWQFLTYEAREMLGMLLKWAGQRDIGMNDTEALALMMSMDPIEATTNENSIHKVMLEYRDDMFSVPGEIVSDCIKICPDTANQLGEGRFLKHLGTEFQIITPNEALELEGLNSFISPLLKGIEGEVTFAVTHKIDSYALVLNQGSNFFAIAADRLHYVSK